MALFLFDTVLNPAAFTLPNNQEFTGLALGRNTLVNCLSTQTLTFVGLPGGVDGMVVAFSNINNSTFEIQFAHESGLAVSPDRRFRNAGLTTVSGGSGAGCVWYRYNGVLSRWIEIAKTA